MRLFTSHTLGSIVRKLKSERKCKLRRRGLLMHFALINRRIEWSAEQGSETHSGRAGTVHEAADQIERLRR